MKTLIRIQTQNKPKYDFIIIICFAKSDTFRTTRSIVSLLRRGSKGFLSGGVNPLSNVSAGTELQATAESAEASSRYHTQDGRHPGESIFFALLPGVACTPCVTVKMAGKILRFSDV